MAWPVLKDEPPAEVPFDQNADQSNEPQDNLSMVRAVEIT